MKIITIIISGLVSSLIGCSSSQVNRHQNTPSNESIESKVAKKMAVFNNADANTVLYPYILLLAKVNNIVDDQGICLPENIELYEAMYKLNKSSLVANSMLGYCGGENDKKIQEYLQTYIAVMESLLKKNDGSSKNNAVEIREFSEAEMILSAGEYTILDYEIVADGDRFYYRIHAVDNLTGAFEYHYYKNFNFLKKVYSKFANFKNDAEVSKFALAIFQKIDNPATTNWLTNHLLASKKYDEVILKLKDHKTLTPISRVNLARAYLYSNKDENLDSLLDDLVAQKDNGDINAGIFLIELLERLNGGKASEKDIQLLLEDIDQRTFVGNGAFLVAKTNYNHGEFDNFEKWSDVSLGNHSKVSYSKLIEFLKRQKAYDALIKLLRKQHKKNNLQATFDLANAYHYGQGVIVDHKVENELYTIASEQGHVDSMYNLANNLENAKFVKQNIDKALYWFKKAGTARSLNQVGYIYYEGAGGIDVDYSEAMKWFLKASDLGNVFSTSNLGLFYQYGKGVEIDYVKAIDFYKAGTTDKYLVTYKRLGDIYQHSLGKKYYKEAEYWYEKGALAGDIKSYERLGDLYQYKKGERDLDKAGKWYKLGAELGHVRSQYEYGLIYARHLDNEQLTLKWFEFVYNSNDHEAIRLVGNSLSNGEKYLKIDQDKAIMFYKKSSGLGNIKAHTDLGYHYETGNGIEKSLEKARRLYQQSATQGNAQGINNLATFYRDGKGGLSVDLEEAFNLYSKASDLGNKFAHNNLAKMHFEGKHVEKSYPKAFELFKKAAKLSFKPSYFYLGYLYMTGEGGEKNYEQAHIYFEKSVMYGDGDSADNLGVMYSQGMGVAKDLEKSVNYFRKAAKLHEIETAPETYIADTFCFGIGGAEQNFSYAKEYYERAIRNGSAAAMNNLGEMYRLGQGVTIDYLKAISLYKRAIEKGDGVSMFNMSEFYRDGLGVKKNANKEFEWMKRSANSGFLPAYVYLSRMYKNATGTHKDIIKSIEWLKKGVEEELSSAFYELSRRLYTVDEMNQNKDEAKRLMQVAADAGDEKALEAIKWNFKDME